jgi:hypothetical protein
MLPPNIALLAAKAKAADSLGIRFTDVTITLLEGAVTEAAVLVDELDACRAISDRLGSEGHELALRNRISVMDTDLREAMTLLRQVADGQDVTAAAHEFVAKLGHRVAAEIQALTSQIVGGVPVGVEA